MQAEMNQIAALFQRGDLAAARKLCAALANKHPNEDKVLYAHAMICQQAGDLEGAIKAYQKTVKVSPNHGQALSNLGGLLTSAGRFEEAEGPLKRALKLMPTSAPARYNLAQTYHGQHNLPAALEQAEKARMLDDKVPDVHSLIGALCDEMRRPKEAAAAYARLTALAPESPGSWTMQASNLQFLGKFDEAEEVLLQGLEAHPGHAGMHLMLSVGKRSESEEAKSISVLRSALETGHHEPEEKTNFLFALGDLYDRAGEFEDAFKNYQAANRLKKQAVPYSSEEYEKITEDVLATYTPSFFEQRDGYGHDSEKPIFVVGNPRSGTTLTERLLSSHPEIVGCGELGDFLICCRAEAWGKAPKPLSVEEIAACDKQAVLAFAENYLSLLAANGPAAQRAVDATPGNLVSLGLISLVFPNAHVVVSQRNPIDTALSNYFRNFAEGSVVYANDITDIVGAFHCQKRILAHYEDVLSLKIHKSKYEDVVADTPGQMTRLLTQLGVDPSATDFDNTASSEQIRSASIWQARQPVYTSSVEKWRNYEKFIGPLIDGLAGIEK